MINDPSKATVNWNNANSKNNGVDTTSKSAMAEGRVAAQLFAQNADVIKEKLPTLYYYILGIAAETIRRNNNPD